MCISNKFPWLWFKDHTELLLELMDGRQVKGGRLALLLSTTVTLKSRE